MNFDPTFAVAAVGAASVLTSILLYKRLREQRGMLEFVEQQVSDLETTLSRNKDLLDTNSQRVGDQARRIAWLETRVRQPRLKVPEPEVEVASVDFGRMSVTERRHRVVKLASRGQTVENIASTLGMFPGEVELIVNLSQAAGR